METREEQMTKLYQAYHSKVLSYLGRHLSEPATAEDLCSDVFLKVYEKLDTFDPERAAYSTWIFTIARNTLTDFFRTHREFSEIPEDLAEGSDIEADYCRSEMLSTLAGALSRMSEKQRDVVILHYYAGKKLVDIAQEMGISYAYVKLLHSKALMELKKYL